MPGRTPSSRSRVFPDTTVAAILASQVLGETAVLAGQRGLQRTVRVVTVLSCPDPTNWLRGGELSLTNGFVFRDRPEDLADVVRILAAHDCAALGVQCGRFIAELPQMVIDTADELDFPLLRLPVELAWGDVIQGVFAQLTTENLRLQSDLLALCLGRYATRPLTALRALTELMGQRLNLRISVFDASGEPLAALDHPPAEFTARAREAIRSGCFGTGDVGVIPLSPDYCLGYLAVQPGDVGAENDSLPQMLEFARQLAANQISLCQSQQELRRFRSQVVHDSLAAERRISPAVLGYGETDRIRGVALRVDSSFQGKGGPYGCMIAEELEDAIRGPSIVVDSQPVGFSRIADLGLLEEHLRALLASRSNIILGCGVSRLVDGRDTALALTESLSCSVTGSGGDVAGVLCYERLGVMSLMLGQMPPVDTQLLVDDIVTRFKGLGPSWREWMHTLETYLASDGSLVQTSHLLHIHPNTLKYRLQKIRSIVPLETFDDKVRLYAILRLRSMHEASDRAHG